jgi:hypothetical protein
LWEFQSIEIAFIIDRYLSLRMADFFALGVFHSLVVEMKHTTGFPLTFYLLTLLDIVIVKLFLPSKHLERKRIFFLLNFHNLIFTEVLFILLKSGWKSWSFSHLLFLFTISKLFDISHHIVTSLLFMFNYTWDNNYRDAIYIPFVFNHSNRIGIGSGVFLFVEAYLAIVGAGLPITKWRWMIPVRDDVFEL